MAEKKRIVTFGGGNGTALTLQALKQHADVFDISAIVSMSDSGGSSGKLRKEFNTLPAGDIMRAIIASSPHAYKGLLKELFYTKRFDVEGKLHKHNLGNLFLVLAAQYAGSFVDAVRALEQAVGSRATIYPATVEQSDLVATLETGETIIGEHEIDRPKDRRRITNLAITPVVPALPEALAAIREAEYIVLGPGSLYCSVVAALLPTGIKEAIAASSAKIVYIAGDIYELQGEAGPTILSDFVHELEAYLPRNIDVVVYNKAQLSEEQKAYYIEKQWGQLAIDKEKLADYTVVGEAFEREHGGLSPEKLSNILYNIITQ